MDTHGKLINAKVIENIKYYLCGSSEMVAEARDILIRHKVPFGNISTEIYF